MNLRSLIIHPDFPKTVWVIVEQPNHEPLRVKYDSQRNTFMRTEYQSLMYVRGFSGAYGWIGGLGTPPGPHSDVILVCDRNYESGEVISAHVFGILYRKDGDHKIVAIDCEIERTISEYDIQKMDEDIHKEVTNIYPEVAENEGWYGVEEAQSYLKKKNRQINKTNNRF